MSCHMYKTLMRIFTFFLLLVLLSTTTTYAQQRKVKKQIEKKGIIYNKEMTFGGKIASNGWGFYMNTGKIINIHKTRLWMIEFSDIRHPKEKKQSADFNLAISGFDSPRDFYYGKQNEFFTLRAAFGYKKNIAEKAKKNGVNLALVYMGGISLGFLKPYYLDLAYITQVNDSTFIVEAKSERYNDDPENGNAQKFLNWYEIIGASRYSKGFKQLQPVPGAFIKLGLNFEWGSRDAFITAMEVGVAADIYYKNIPIMINQPQRPFFMNAYLSFELGRRR